MEIEIKLPELGDGIKSGDILEILVQVGDAVAKDQGLVEVETDKATVTLPSTHAGKVTQLRVKPGDSVPVGGVIATLEVASAAAAPAPRPAAPSAPAKPAAPTAVAPAAPTTPAASSVAPPPAPAAAAPAPLAAPPAAAPAPAVAPVARTSASPAPAAPAPVVSARAASAEVTSGETTTVPAGPAVRRFAREVGVDLSQVRGTGIGGRITRDDVLAAVRAANQMARSAPVAERTTTTAIAAAPAPVASPAESASAATDAVATDRDAWGPIRIEKLTKIRRTIAAKMHESWTTVPRVTNMDDADVTELERIRQASKDDYAARGIKLTSLPFLVKAVAMALKAHPVLNASIDLESGTLIYKEYVHIGIAVDSDRGLVVPSLRNADRLTISEIARQLAALANKVRDNAFAIDDLRGSTFTISNLGAIGGTYATPIVNTPEVAILLAGRARKLPVVVDDQIVPRLMMPLSLSYDHRVVDGGAAARFLNDVIAYLRAPGRLLLAP